jgi:hypothetical protein
VTAWRRALTGLTSDPGTARPVPAATAAHVTGAVPASIAAELVDALAAVALAGT